jgi:peptidyl-prolyl cis-trans isomerase D
MLQGFRTGVEKYGKWLVILIAIPFVFFGIESIFIHGGGAEEAARVDGERITRLELDQAVERQRSYFQRRFGEIDPKAIDEALLRGPALENLIATRALESHARTAGMGVAPQLVAKVLREAPMFQVDGNFSRDTYLVYLRQMGYTPQSHSRFLARELLVSQLARGLTQSAFVSRQEVASAIAAWEETRDFSYLEIPFASLSSKVEFDEADIEAYYRDHAGEYADPEQVILDYVELSRDAMAQGLAIGEAELRERYEERIAETEAAARRIVAQILVRPAEDGSRPDKLERIEAALAAGKDFAALAAAESEDPLTAESGGELGPYVAEDFPEPLRAAIEALAVGEVSAPVESDQGWHILKVVRDDKPRLGSFEEEREALRAELAQQRADELFAEQVERLAELAYTAEGLAEVGEELKLPVQTSAPLTRNGGEGLGAEAKVLAAAFSDAVLSGGQLSPVIELGDGRALVLGLREHRPAKPKPIAEVRTAIVAALTAERGAALAMDWAERLRGELEAGTAIDQLAKQAQLPVRAYLDVARYAEQPERKLLDGIFAAPAGEGLPVSRVVRLTDRVVICQVTGIHPGDPDEVPEQRRAELERALRTSIAARELGDYQEMVLAGADVEIRDAAPPPGSP